MVSGLRALLEGRRIAANENDLLVVPDQEDKFIRLELDEQPK